MHEAPLPDTAAREHLFKALAVLVGLGIVVSIVLFLVKDFFVPSEATLELVTILALSLCVTVAYIVFLLLTARTRAKLTAAIMTKSLRETAEQFVSMYDDAPVPYIRLDAKGLIHDPNKATLRFFGVTSPEIENQNFFGFFADEFEEQKGKLFQYYTSSIPVDRVELRMKTKTHGERWVLVSVFAMKDPETGAHVGLASVFDVTDAKKLEQAKTEFVSLASHQLRTPLATTKWYSDMLLDNSMGELNDKQKEYVTTLSRVNDEMIDLVNTLLNVSRLEIGTLPIEKSTANVEDITESILVELGSQIAQKRLQIKKEYNSSLTAVETDPKLLRIVIQNLISNSVKYTPDGGTITITMNESGTGRNLAVADTGYGIPVAEQSHIFEKLYRAENVKKLSSSQGTGLGLYLVKSIIEALGGSISFVSTEGGGSTFTITF